MFKPAKQHQHPEQLPTHVDLGATAEGSVEVKPVVDSAEGEDEAFALVAEQRYAKAMSTLSPLL